MDLLPAQAQNYEFVSVAHSARADAESAAVEEGSRAFAFERAEFRRALHFGRLKCWNSPSNHYEPERSSQQEAVSAFSQKRPSFRTVRTRRANEVSAFALWSNR
jgi:hypothetical protein